MHGRIFEGKEIDGSLRFCVASQGMNGWEAVCQTLHGGVHKAAVARVDKSSDMCGLDDRFVWARASHLGKHALVFASPWSESLKFENSHRVLLPPDSAPGVDLRETEDVSPVDSD